MDHNMTDPQETKLREMAARRCRNQMDEAKRANLSEEEGRGLVFALLYVTEATYKALAIVPRHLRNLTMQLFLEEQEMMRSAQEKYETVTTENQPILDEAVLSQMRKQAETFKREKVSSAEKELVTLSLLSMAMHMSETVDSLPRHIALLFLRLATEQFKELIVICNMDEN